MMRPIDRLPLRLRWILMYPISALFGLAMGRLAYLTLDDNPVIWWLHPAPVLVMVFAFAISAIVFAPAKMKQVTKVSTLAVLVMLGIITIATIDSWWRGYPVISLEEFMHTIIAGITALAIADAIGLANTPSSLWGNDLDAEQTKLYNMNVFNKHVIAAILSIAIVVGITVFGLVSLVSSVSVPATPTQTAQQPEAATPPTVPELLELTNAERAKVGVAPLVIDDILNQSAQYKAQHMRDGGYFDHKDSNGRLNGIDKGYELGADCRYLSENITDNVYVNDSQSAIDAWVNSRSHYEAMINPEYTRTGFGIADTKIVQHFCVAN